MELQLLAEGRELSMIGIVDKKEEMKDLCCNGDVMWFLCQPVSAHHVLQS